MAYEAGGFAAFTVQERLPRILADICTAIPPLRDERMAALERAIIQGGAIETAFISPVTPFWAEASKSLAGATWRSLPFFGLEFLFYHSINSIAATQDCADQIFAPARRNALDEAMVGAEAMAKAALAGVAAALDLCLFGNALDLSQLNRAAACADRLVVDRRSQMAEAVACANRGIVILADNAGQELLADLLLVDAILTRTTATVDLHVKPWPMFVSDALEADVTDTIAALTTAGSVAAAAGARLNIALGDGRLRLRAPCDWGEPRHMHQLEAGLLSDLRAAAIVLVKGDLNYRRFFGDRRWPSVTPVPDASLAHGMHAYALRIAKSDLAVGVAEDMVASLDATDPDWRISGRFGMVQRIDDGSIDATDPDPCR